MEYATVIEIARVRNFVPTRRVLLGPEHNTLIQFFINLTF